MEKRELAEARSQFVVMGNDLIQKSRYNLSLMEQKLVLFMVSKIKPYDTPGTDYVFTFNEFEAVCNLNRDGGKSKRLVYSMLLDLKTKPVELRLGEKKVLITSWFNNALFDAETDTVRIDFSKYLTPYLYDIQKLYTQFCLENVLAMKSKYAVRLYEYLKSVKNMGYKQIMALDELKGHMGAEKYSLYKDFRVRALEPAIEEINRYTDLEIRWEEKKTGRKVSHIVFIILSSNEPSRYLARHRELNG